MLTDSERNLKLRFLRFARHELQHIATAPALYRRDYLRLASMIRSMHLSGYLTIAQASILGGMADIALVTAMRSEESPREEGCCAIN